MGDELQHWAVQVLRFALREPTVAAGEAVLHVVDTGADGPHRFRGSVLPGDRTVAAQALDRARDDVDVARWAVSFVTWIPDPGEAWLICDCSDGGAPQRFATALRPTADGMTASRMVSLGPTPRP
ncbi:MAG: hypothetical protein AB8H79_12730 [Myxococcota bacterium]